MLSKDALVVGIPLAMLVTKTAVPVGKHRSVDMEVDGTHSYQVQLGVASVVSHNTLHARVPPLPVPVSREADGRHAPDGAVTISSAPLRDDRLRAR